ncbi:hypothetical protein PGTUg99_010650 [Puccinia graminis f. sp. tritici]|uniref:Uncharacterized protein n=1 Tax=Puccinia graminis f. sp. tritici TaxID=56615 RepID=A0A5B0NVM8_PUCGR|nr:hypothetical protein PGTUg99_010650 [Puccinia graminis f. sp. tritici]
MMRGLGVKRIVSEEVPRAVYSDRSTKKNQPNVFNLSSNPAEVNQFTHLAAYWSTQIGPSPQSKHLRPSRLIQQPWPQPTNSIQLEDLGPILLIETPWPTSHPLPSHPHPCSNWTEQTALGRLSSAQTLKDRPHLSGKGKPDADECSALFFGRGEPFPQPITHPPRPALYRASPTSHLARSIEIDRQPTHTSPPCPPSSLPPPASPSLDLDKPIKIGSSTFLSSLDELLPSSDRINRQPTTNTAPPPSSELSRHRPGLLLHLARLIEIGSILGFFLACRQQAIRGSRIPEPPPTFHSSPQPRRLPTLLGHPQPKTIKLLPPPSSPQPLSPSASPSIAVLNARTNDPTTGPFLGS